MHFQLATLFSKESSCYSDLDIFVWGHFEAKIRRTKPHKVYELNIFMINFNKNSSEVDFTKLAI